MSIHNNPLCFQTIVLYIQRVQINTNWASSVFRKEKQGGGLKEREPRPRDLPLTPLSIAHRIVTVRFHARAHLVRIGISSARATIVAATAGCAAAADTLSVKRRGVTGVVALLHAGAVGIRSGSSLVVAPRVAGAVTASVLTGGGSVSAARL